MNKLRSSGCYWLVVVLVAGWASAATLQAIDPRVLTLFGGQENLAPVTKPTKVEAFRLVSTFSQPADADGAATAKKIAEWPIVSGPVTVDAKTAAELTAVFIDPKTYEWESAKACEFDPGVAIRFTDKTGSTDVLLCFSCDEMAVVRDGKRVGGEDTDNARKKLVAVAKKLFPDDKAIQELDKP